MTNEEIRAKLTEKFDEKKERKRGMKDAIKGVKIDVHSENTNTFYLEGYLDYLFRVDLGGEG